MNAQDFKIRYYHMNIAGLGDHRFVVAKLRRVSSPPVQMGTVSDSMGSALGRLADIIRLGRESRNYKDLTAIEWMLQPTWMVDVETEWAEYERVIARGIGVERLEPFRLSRPGMNDGQSHLAVTYHEATMDDKPYLVAATGNIMGSPAPVYLTCGFERESALARLRDVFKVGVQGQVFRDFVEAGRRLGKKEAEVVKEWQEGEGAALCHLRRSRRH